MTADFKIDAGRSAVLSMDYQVGIVSIYAGSPIARNAPAAVPVDTPEGGTGGADSGVPAVVRRAANVLKHARERGIRVIHVRVGFRPNLPEISSRNMLLSSIKNSVQHRQFFEGASGEIHPAVAPEAEEIVITKHRISAFAGTDLAMILRANDIDTLVMYGIATSGVVLATLLEATDSDYRVAVVKDCCADQDPEVHSCLLEKLFPRFATVIAAEEFLAE